MSDMRDVVDRYLDIWNETDQAVRRAAIEALWQEDAVFVDPLASVSGHADIEAYIANAQEQVSGMTFVRGEIYDAHHNIVRFTWNLRPADREEAVIVGFDVAVIGHDGKLAGVYGFIDKMPPQA